MYSLGSICISSIEGRRQDIMTSAYLSIKHSEAWLAGTSNPENVWRFLPLESETNQLLYINNNLCAKNMSLFILIMVDSIFH